jgi:uncharacterized protein
MLVEIGKVNHLKILRKTSNGLYLDGQTLGDVLLPRRYVPLDVNVGDNIDVFVYLDSEDRLIATTETPLAQAGEFAYLTAVSTTKFGAFLHWGLMKDLLVPFREQAERMEKDRNYLVFVYIDYETGRIVASSRLNKFLDNVSPKYEAGQEVDLIIASKTPMGYKAIVNNRHTGMLYDNQVFKSLAVGQRLTGYINKVRVDDKIDLLLEQPGYEKTDSQSQELLDILKKNGGYMTVNDKTEPDEITRIFGMSKKNFKKALGALYKNKLVEIEDEGVRVVTA